MDKTFATRALRAFVLPAALAAITTLGGCGGSDDNTTGGGGGGGGGGTGGTLTLSAANPSAHNTTAEPGKAATVGNDARAADAFSGAAYCDIYWEDFTAANSKHYALQVYFRQGDKQPLHASLIDASAGAPMWVAFHNDSGKPIGGIAVDTGARTVTFTNKVLAGSAGEAVTLSGTVGFATNSSVAACGN